MTASRQTRWRWLCTLVLACWPSLSSPVPSFSNRYDGEIERAARDWLPAPTRLFGWQVLKAQYYQESRLDPAARSHVGAAGIAQFMPGTWRDVSRQLSYGLVSPHQVEYAIPAGAYYMMTLRRGWMAERTEYDRMCLSQASYNAGPGNISRSQRLAFDKRSCAGVLTELHRVTGRHATETRTYVDRIWRWWRIMANWS